MALYACFKQDNEIELERESDVCSVLIAGGNKSEKCSVSLLW